VDVTAPSITAASNSTVECDGAGNTSALNAWLTNNGGATATDVCSGVSWSNNFTSLSDLCGATGAATVVFTATDACGNTSTTSAIFTIVDVTAPVISGVGGPQTIYCPATPLFSAPTANDACGGSSLSFNDVTIAGSCAGTYSVKRTWTATDACGNTATASQTITVTDNAAPVITPTSSPAPPSLGYNPTPSAVNAALGTATASDNCSSASTTQSDGPVVSAGCNRSQTRTWTSTDACGNISSTSVTVSWLADLTAPSITCPANITLSACTPTATWATPSTSDICSGVTVVQTAGPASGSTFANGTTTTIVYKATDDAGNTATCSFTVTRTATLGATITTNNPNLYFGYSADQNATITVYPSGGVAPYKVSITMVDPPVVVPARPVERVGGALICNYINAAGDEVWTPGTNTASTTGNACGSTPVSTSNPNIPVGGNYWIKATLLTDARFIATVTDANGCTYTIPYAQAARVDAEDARCFAGNSGVAKVTICHKTGSATNPCVTLCVDESAVAAHIAHGDFVGKCTQNCLPPVNNSGLGIVQTDVLSEIITVEKFNVKAYPNPTENQFTLMLEGASNEKVLVVVYDAVGRQVKKIERSDAGGTIRFGEDLKVGAYFVEVRQGENRKTIKLIKQ